jgi:hypothetical protein
MISPARDEYRFGHSLTTRPALVGTATSDKRDLDDTLHQELRIPYRKESGAEGVRFDNADGWTIDRDVQTRRVICAQCCTSLLLRWAYHVSPTIDSGSHEDDAWIQTIQDRQAW